MTIQLAPLFSLACNQLFENDITVFIHEKFEDSLFIKLDRALRLHAVNELLEYFSIFFLLSNVQIKQLVAECLKLINLEVLFFIIIVAFEELIKVLLHLVQIFNTLDNKSIPETVENWREQQVEESVESEDEKGDEVKAPEEICLVGGKHNVGEVCRS